MNKLTVFPYFVFVYVETEFRIFISVNVCAWPECSHVRFVKMCVLSFTKLFPLHQNIFNFFSLYVLCWWFLVDCLYIGPFEVLYWWHLIPCCKCLFSFCERFINIDLFIKRAMMIVVLRFLFILHLFSSRLVCLFVDHCEYNKIAF